MRIILAAIGILYLCSCVNKEVRNPSSDEIICESPILDSQIKDEVVRSLTSIETRVDEVGSLKINKIDSKVEDNRKLISLAYSLILTNPSKLSSTIHLSDPERKKMEVTINAQLPCVAHALSARLILLNGQMYNDVSDDDRTDLDSFNESHKNLLVIDNPN